MNTLRRGCFNFLVLLVVAGLGFLLVQVTRSEVEKKEAREQEIERLKEQFQQEIERAKLATFEPCASVFYEFVMPPAGVSGTAKLIMMGKEIDYISLDPSSYKLLPKENRVELWASSIAAQRYGESSRTWFKISEKFSPESPTCKK